MPTPWWYLKKLKNPPGKLGRPCSAIPFAERRRLARSRYKAKLNTRGLKAMRILLPASAAALLRKTAQVRKISAGEVVVELLANSPDEHA